MGTSSTIGYEVDGAVYYVSCNWDGHPGHVGRILAQHYNTVEKVEALVALGNISSLEKTIACPDGHCFDNRAKDCTTFYERDRGELDQHLLIVSTAQYLDRNYNEEQYNYVFINGQWFMRGATDGPGVPFNVAYPQFAPEQLDHHEQRVVQELQELADDEAATKKENTKRVEIRLFVDVTAATADMDSTIEDMLCVLENDTDLAGGAIVRADLRDVV